MSYTGTALLTLAMQCAPNVAPQTVAAIVVTESGGKTLALNINGPVRRQTARTVEGAVTIARRSIASGFSVDLGLGQINSRNMAWLGLTWETVFDPCHNIAALGRVLTANYAAALAGRDPQTALRVALSLYNTGSAGRGFRNGYVARVVGNALVAETAPPLVAMSTGIESSPGKTAADFGARGPTPPPSRPAPPPRWSVFEHAAFSRDARSFVYRERLFQ